MSLSEDKAKLLHEKAFEIRRSVVEMLIRAKSGHLAGSLGMADIFAYLYFEGLRHDPKKPSWTYRDRLVLSNGHIAPVLYATMAHSGYFAQSELLTLRKLGSRLQGHPHREFMPSLETSSGPLGTGLSQAVGMALADVMDNGVDSDKRIYCLISDGELDEGNTWEAAMLAAKHKLKNLIVIMDRNGIQLSGSTEDIMPLEPLVNKWQSFGFNVEEIDGHNFSAIDRAITSAKRIKDQPTIIFAYTIPSKGIPEFEGKYEWHGKPPMTDLEIETALKPFSKNA